MAGPTVKKLKQEQQSLSDFFKRDQNTRLECETLHECLLDENSSHHLSYVGYAARIQRELKAASDEYVKDKGYKMASRIIQERKEAWKSVGTDHTHGWILHFEKNFQTFCAEQDLSGLITPIPIPQDRPQPDEHSQPQQRQEPEQPYHVQPLRPQPSQPRQPQAQPARQLPPPRQPNRRLLYTAFKNVLAESTESTISILSTILQVPFDGSKSEFVKSLEEGGFLSEHNIDQVMSILVLSRRDGGAGLQSLAPVVLKGRELQMLYSP